MIAGTLEIRLMAEMASLKRGMDEANRTVTGAMSRIESATATAARALGAFGGTLAVGAMVNQLNQVYDALAELDDMAQKTGASVENLSRLQKVANVVGQEFGAVDAALVKLAKGMATADSETDKAQAALRALGVSAKDASGKLRDPGEVMIEVARRLQLYQDGAAKAALMNDLLGKSGAQLLPYLNDVAEFSGRVRAETDASAKAAAHLGDSLGFLKQRVSDVWSDMAVQLLPVLLKITDAFSQSSEASKDFSAAVKAISIILEALIVVGSTVAFAFRGIANEVTGIYERLKLIAKGDFSGSWALYEKMQKEAAAARKDHDAFIDAIMGGQKKLDQVAATAKENKKQELNYTSGGTSAAKAIKEAKDQISDYQKLAYELSKLTAERYRQLYAGRELTPVEKQLSDLASSIADGTKKMTAEEFAAAGAMIKEAGAAGQLVDEQQKLFAIRERNAKISDDFRMSEMDRLERLKMEADLVGRSAEQQAILRAEYEAQARLKRTVADIANSNPGDLRDLKEEEMFIENLRKESEARIKIIKDEELAKARAKLDAAALAIQQDKPTQDRTELVGWGVTNKMAFDAVESERVFNQWRMQDIDALEKRQKDYFREYELAADQAQMALLDKDKQVYLAETERINEIRRLRATGEAHNIALADQYAKTLENRGLMEEVGYAIAKRNYALAAQELETAQKSAEIKDIEAMRLAAIEKYQTKIQEIQDRQFSQLDLQVYGERELESQKEAQLKLAAEEYIQTAKQIESGKGIIEIQKEQLKLQEHIAIYKEHASAGQAASRNAEKESLERLAEENRLIHERFDAQRWEDRINRFEQDLRTSWLRLLDHNTQSWNAFIKGLLNTFKTSLFDEIYRMLLKPFTFKIIASLVGLTGAGAAGAAADKALGTAIDGSSLLRDFKDSEGNGFGVMNWLSVGKTIWTGMSNGFAAFGNSIAGYTSQFGMYLVKGQGMLSDFGTMLVNSAGKISLAASYIGAAAAGISIGSLLAGDKSVLGMDGLTTSAIGAGIGAIFGGPIGAFAGGILGGVVNALFGMGEKNYGATNVAGSFTGAGFSGNLQTDWTQKGGLFRSNKSGTVEEALSETAQNALNGITLGVATSFGKLLSVTGEAARSLDGWAFAIKREIKTDEDWKKLIADLGDSMGKHLIPEIESFRKEGESLADTAIRLTDTFIVTQAIYDMLGHSAYATGLASLQMRDDLVQLFGGLQQTSQAMSSFYSNFYTADEQRANSIRQIDNAFKSLGLTMPETREQFRQLVEAQDLTTAEGRLLFAALMQIAPGFAAVTDPIEDVAQKLKDLAEAAKQAMNSIASSLDQMRGTGVASTFQAQLRLNSAMSAVTAAMPWITSWDQLATIQIEDAAQYSDANKILIAEAIAAGAALGQLVKTAEDAAKALKDKVIADAFAALRRAVDAEKDRLTKIYNEQTKALNDNISKLRGLSDALGSTLDSIRPMSRGAAQAQLTSALLLAKTGGIFPTADELSGALRAVSEPSQWLFSSFVDYQRDQAYTANTIDALKKLTDGQLSIEEQTLKQLEDTHNAEMERLDAIITSAQAQIDAMNGVNTSVLSVAQALANFAQAMGVPVSSIGGENNAPTSAGGSSVAGSKLDAWNSVPKGPITRGTYQGLPIGYTEADAGGINWVEGYGNAVDPYAEVQRRIALRQALGIPGFASGGVHEGGWRMVGEDGPEVEYTPPSRIYSNRDSKKLFDVDAIVNEVRELRKEVKAGHVAIATNTGKTSQIMRRWEGNGVPVRLADSADPLQVNVVESVAVPVS